MQRERLPRIKQKLCKINMWRNQHFSSLHHGDSIIFLLFHVSVGRIEGNTDVIALEFQSFVFNLKPEGSITGTTCDILYVSTCHHILSHHGGRQYDHHTMMEMTTVIKPGHWWNCVYFYLKFAPPGHRVSLIGKTHLKKIRVQPEFCRKRGEIPC